jgi:tetratricopeptide (TPR) repeat protein
VSLSSTETIGAAKVREEKHWLDLLIRVCISAGLLFGVCLVAAQGIAEWHFHQNSSEGLRRAIQWDPGNAEYYVARARILQFSLEGVDINEVIHLQEMATRLSPESAQYWAELAGSNEWAGREEGARYAYERARQLFPNSPEFNWKLGNFYIRTGRIRESLGALQKTLSGNAEMRRPAFDLVWRAGLDSGLILREMIPADPEILLAYLNYLLETQRVDEAGLVWARLLDQKSPLELQAAFPYLDALIRQERLDQLKVAWAALMERSRSGAYHRSFDGNLITNGSFEGEILDGGLDWRVIPVEGADVSVDALIFFDGTRSLRIRFDGQHNLDYSHVFQYVPVQPNSLYRFAGYVRAQGITTDSGPRFEIRDAHDASKLSVSTEGVAGILTWSLQQLQFRTGPKTQSLIVRIVRPQSHAFDGRISGTVWIDRLSLSAVE